MLMMTDAGVQAVYAAGDLLSHYCGQPWIWSLAEYLDEQGHFLFGRLRLDPKPGNNASKIIYPISHNGQEWVLAEPDFPNGKPLYWLPDIVNHPDATVWVVEGEKCANTLREMGMVATTSGGASSAGQANWQPLAGRNVVIWPDNDAPGFQYARQVTDNLQALNCTVRWVGVEHA